MPPSEVPTIDNPLWLPPTPESAFIAIISATPQLQWCRLRDRGIDRLEYLSHGYPAGYACRLLATSPDGAVIAVATLQGAQGSLTPGAAIEVVRRVDLATSLTDTITTPSEHGAVAGIEWTPSQWLIVTDGDMDTCHETTTIFPPGSIRASAQLPGHVQAQGWNLARTAFFIAFHCPYGLAGDFRLSGFDLVSGEPFPELVPIYEATQGFESVQGPTWFRGGTSLAVTVREGRWLGEFAEFATGPSYIVVFEISPSGPSISRIIAGERTDYAFAITETDELSISSAPSTAEWVQ